VKLARSIFAFYGLLLIALIAIGYFREYIFVSINYQLYRLYYHVEAEYPLPDQLKFLTYFTHKQLYYTKWVLTLLFVLLYFFITRFVLAKIFEKRAAMLKLTIGLHLLLILIAAMSYCYDLVFEHTHYKGYELSRVFMGFLQSPLVLMILIPTFKLSDKLSDKNQE
jgi:hypothetical protein